MLKGLLLIYRTICATEISPSEVREGQLVELRVSFRSHKSAPDGKRTFKAKLNSLTICSYFCSSVLNTLAEERERKRSANHNAEERFAAPKKRSADDDSLSTYGNLSFIRKIVVHSVSDASPSPLDYPSGHHCLATPVRLPYRDLILEDRGRRERAFFSQSIPHDDEICAHFSDILRMDAFTPDPVVSVCLPPAQTTSTQ